MTRPARGHLALITPTDRVVPLAAVSWSAPTVAGVPELVVAVVTAAQHWANEADTVGCLLGWAPSDSSDLGQATLRLLDAVHTLQARDAAPPDSVG